MRRLCLIALLAAPGLTAAATPPTPGAGQITWSTVAHTDEDGFINLAECAAGSISLSWSPDYAATVFTGGSITTTRSFTLYASNTQHGNTCYAANNTAGGNNILAGPVATVTAGLTNPMTASFDTSVITSVAGRSCAGNADEDVFLCIQAKDASNTAIGVARLRPDGTAAKLVLSRSRPAAPPLSSVSARPGEQAANVSWSDGGGATASDTYRVDAWLGGAIVKSSPRITGTSYRLTGLTNDQTYGISVISFSAAGNPSGDPEIATSVTPSHVLDFWEYYKDAGGREEGGCAGGPAGPVALVAAAAALVLARRRKQ